MRKLLKYILLLTLIGISGIDMGYSQLNVDVSYQNWKRTVQVNLLNNLDDTLNLVLTRDGNVKSRVVVLGHWSDNIFYESFNLLDSNETNTDNEELSISHEWLPLAPGKWNRFVYELKMPLDMVNELRVIVESVYELNGREYTSKFTTYFKPDYYQYRVEDDDD